MRHFSSLETGRSTDTYRLFGYFSWPPTGDVYRDVRLSPSPEGIKSDLAIPDTRPPGCGAERPSSPVCPAFDHGRDQGHSPSLFDRLLDVSLRGRQPVVPRLLDPGHALDHGQLGDPGAFDRTG